MKIPRLKSRAYRISAFFVVAWIVVAVAMAIGRISFFRDDNACVIGLEKFATIPMLARSSNFFHNVLSSLSTFPTAFVSPR